MADVPARDAGLASGILERLDAGRRRVRRRDPRDAAPTDRTSSLLADEAHAHRSALMSGYHLAFGLAAILVATAIVAALTLLRPTNQREPAQQRGHRDELVVDADAEPLQEAA